jgi:F420-dependent oxidoreductase-like protein
MKIGLFVPLSDRETVDDTVKRLVDAERRGFSSVWLNQIRGFDALTMLAVAGTRTSSIELGTFVVPTYPRHPSALAGQALTVQSASDNRLTLGIGLSHRVSMQDALGFDWSHPVRHMREYLSCLKPLLAGEEVTFQGEEFLLTGYKIGVPGTTPPPVLVAALGPQMLAVTGRLADGTALWLGGAAYIRDHVVPAITRAAADAGRPAPRILAGLPVCVTDRADEVRQRAAQVFERYGELPSYRAVLDREGAPGPADVGLFGTEDEVHAGIDALAQAGATDFIASLFTPRGEDPERTMELLRTMG